MAEKRLVHDATRHRGPKRIGSFATRFPSRPNPIGLSLVELVSKRGGVLKVRGLVFYRYANSRH
jgi:tRNA (Thr-GGU) A37 N-methylase